MTSPRFFDRFADAALPLFEGADRAALRGWTEGLGQTLRAPSSIEEHPGHTAGFLLLCNLGARLYPRLHVDAPPSLVHHAHKLIHGINPGCELLGRARPEDVTLAWGDAEPAARIVVVNARAWTAYIDHGGMSDLTHCESLAGLAAGAIGAAQAFRAAFGDQLGPRARTGPEPGTLNLITQNASTDELVPLAEPFDLGVVHLAGCGAIGQACALALSHTPVKGTLWAVDHERVQLSNLQRYVLTYDADVKAHKPALIARVLDGSALEVKQLRVRWGGHKQAGPGAETVLTALDTAADRIDVQGSLPRAIYNAYTQPADLGISRHERFGEDACLACLYWPHERLPGRHEQLAAALDEHPLRTLGYLVTKVPVGKPLPSEAVQPAGHLTLPDDAGTWTERSLLEDLGSRWALDGEQTDPWADVEAEDFYVSAVCGGGIITDAATGRDVVVPLAHQSAMAGILLAAQLVAARHPELAAHRPDVIQGRLDLLGPLPAHMRHPLGRTTGCICSDDDFVAHWRQAWGREARSE